MKKLVIIFASIVVLSIVVFALRPGRQNPERNLAPEPIAETEVKNLDLERLFSHEPIDESFIYEVQPKDTLAAIAKKFNTTIDLLALSNQLQNPDTIRLGQKLKVIKGKFNIIVNVTNLSLSLFLDDQLVKIYPVGIGKDRSTPIGEFQITTKVINPPWYPPEGGVYAYGDPENILGTRWMGISAQGYGIHGTTQPETIGKDVSRGCVRMYNQDIEELFKIVPRGTNVIIKE